MGTHVIVSSSYGVNDRLHKHIDVIATAISQVG